MDKIYKIQQMILSDGSTQVVPEIEEYCIQEENPQTYIVSIQPDTPTWYIGKSKIGAVTLGPKISDNNPWQDVDVFVKAQSQEEAIKQAADVLVDYYHDRIDTVEQWVDEMMQYINGPIAEMEFETCDIDLAND